MDQRLAINILSHRDQASLLFKPGQMAILKKVAENEPLDENEKRYLRGRLGRVLNILSTLMTDRSIGPGLEFFCKHLNEYYITGLSALKYNGYGWYYDPKWVEIVNTRLEGTIDLSDVRLKLIRVKSISKKEWQKDDRTGLRYATNEQVLKDTKLLKDPYIKKVWWTMQDRYGSMFSDIPTGFKREKGPI